MMYTLFITYLPHTSHSGEYVRFFFDLTRIAHAYGHERCITMLFYPLRNIVVFSLSSYHLRNSITHVTV